ncbi:unnamed protein product [Urochloa humidicola]
MAALPDELVEEFLRRLPPSEPALLVRAAAVCRRWCRIISDAGFRRRFREFHRAPPAIAVLHNSIDGDAYVARFTPYTATSFPPCAAGGRRGEAVLDCRHGRVLLRRMPAVGVDLSSASADVSFLDVWDPVADEHWEVPLPYFIPYKFSVTVLCAAAAAGTCDHLDCHGGPFTVVLRGTDLESMFVYAYSSEAATWSEAASIHLGTTLNYRPVFRPALVSSDAMIYFIIEHMMFKYDVAVHVVTKIDPPPSLHGNGNMTLVEAKDGGLGFMNVEGYNIHVWSWQGAGGSNGVEQWVKDQVIKLDIVMPSIATGGPSAKFDVVGFGEGTDIIFVSANAGVFVVWRKSGHVMKVREKMVFMASYLDVMFSFQSFYNPALEPAPCMSLAPRLGLLLCSVAVSSSSH